MSIKPKAFKKRPITTAKKKTKTTKPVGESMYQNMRGKPRSFINKRVKLIRMEERRQRDVVRGETKQVTMLIDCSKVAASTWAIKLLKQPPGDTHFSSR